MKQHLKPTARHLNRRKLVWIAIAASLIFVMYSTRSLAQSGVGTIQGIVSDSSGAAISNARVHVLNQKTGQAFDTISNSTGFYSAPSLFTGDYTLTFNAPGMKAYQTSINLLVAQTAVINPTLVIASSAQQITVTGNTVQLTTQDSGTISSVLENSRINQLPMNGRNLVTLADLTTPGLEGNRANGNMGSALEYVQDGAPLYDRSWGQPTRLPLPDPDAIQEVNIETADSSARYSSPATAIITTKSGTNGLHGTFFETMRNNYIGIAKARQDPYNLKAPHLVRNEFGASVGGPIVIPKIYNGKDKSFFFFAFERLSLRSAVSELVHTPTAAMRNGDFSGLVNSQGILQVLYNSQTSDPTTFVRQPYANNQIPLTSISPLAKTLYAISPLPTSSDNPLIQSNLTTAGINNQTAPTFTVRVDHSPNMNNRLYLVYKYLNFTDTVLRNYPTHEAATVAGAGFAAGAANLESLPTYEDNFSLGYTHVFSPTFFSETVLSNEWELDATRGGGDINQDYESKLGLPNNFGAKGFPWIGINNLFMNYEGSQFNSTTSQILTSLDENFTKVIGRHQLFFGGRYGHERIGVLPDQREDEVAFSAEATGQIDQSSGKLYTQLANTGNPNADFFLGAASNYLINMNMKYWHLMDQSFDTYFQDDIHLNDRLTINLGVRWEAHPAVTEAHHLIEGFDYKNKAIVLGEPASYYIARGFTTQGLITNLANLGAKTETPQQAGLPENMVNNNNFAISPRIGIAYLPFGDQIGTVLRGGFGRYIYPVPTRNFYANSASNVPFQAAYNQSYTAANQSPDGQPNYLLRTPQTVVAGQNSSGVVDTSGDNSLLPGISLFSLNRNYPVNYVTQANVTLEQPLKGSSVVRLSYLWDHGSNLDQIDYINNPPSTYVWEKATGTVPPIGYYSQVATRPYDQTTYGNLNQQQRSGWSNDNALQVNYQRLYKAGYAYQFFYVFSRAYRVGGNSFVDGSIYPLADFAPGMAPTTDPHQLNVFLNYKIDTAIPEHHISFNGIVDLPLGRGKALFGHANRFVDELIGGYQIAGDANVYSEYFQPFAGNWGATNPIHVYKRKYKVNDCRSGVCHPGYLWYNGFIAPNLINTAKGVSGIPSDYGPYQTPINMVSNTPTYLTNYVPVTLANGKTVTTPYAPGPGLNPYSKTFLHGPFNWTADISLFKVFRITDTTDFRVNIDAFNAFNVQGYNNPDPVTGIQNFLSSHNVPRQVQFTARLTF